MLRLTKRLRPTLAAALALAAVPAAILVPTPAQADYFTQSMRLKGTWTTPNGRLEIKFDYFEGVLTGEYWERGTGLKYRLWWAEEYATVPNEDVGRAIDMYIVSKESSNNWNCRLFVKACQAGRVLLKVSRDGRILEAEHISGVRIEPDRSWKATRRVDPSPDGERAAPWVGSWDTSEGRINFEIQGDMLVGSWRKSGSSGPAGEGTIVMPASAPAISGRWDLENSFPRERGRIELELAPDGQSFTGKRQYAGSRASTGADRWYPWTGKRVKVADEPTGESPSGTDNPGPEPTGYAHQTDHF
jgi:hypothetical protein